MNRATALLVAPLLVVAGGIAACPSFLFAQPPGRGGPPGMQGPPTEMIIQLFTQADANRDGVVTKAELSTALRNQSSGNRRGQMGPPPQGDNFMPANQKINQGPPAGDHGSPPQPGQVLPDPVAQSLNLTVKQTRKLEVLQREVDKRLASILTAEQEEQLKNFKPPQRPEGGNNENGRPQRPQ